MRTIHPILDEDEKVFVPSGSRALPDLVRHVSAWQKGPMVRRALVALLLLDLACAGPIRMTDGELADRATGDIVAMQMQLRDQTIVVMGAPDSKDLASQQYAEGSAGLSGLHVTVEKRHRQIPVVTFGAGRVQCFFPESSMEEVASLQVGQPTSLRCIFREYQKSAAGYIAVLGDCGVVK